MPAEYYVPAEATKALEILRAHGVQMRAVTQPVNGVERFAIATNVAAQRRIPTASTPARTACAR